MITRTIYGGAKAFTHAALLVAGLSLSACAPDSSPEQESRETISSDSVRTLAAAGATTTVQMNAATPVITLEALLGAEYAAANVATFELVGTTSEGGSALT